MSATEEGAKKTVRQRPSSGWAIQTLNRAIQGVLSASELAQACEAIAAAAEAFFAPDAISIQRFSSSGEGPSRLWERGLSPSAKEWLRGAIAEAEHAIPARMLREGRAALLIGPSDLPAPVAEEGFRALWVALAQHSHQLAGALCLWFKEPRQLRESEQAPLAALASQASVAFERFVLLARQAALVSEGMEIIERRLAEVSALYNMAQQVTRSLALEEVLDAIVVQLRAVISCRAIAVFLLDPDTEELTIAAATGLKPEFRQRTRLKIGEGISGVVFKEVRPIYVRDIPTEAPDLGTDPSIRSLLVVPLIAKSKVIGTLSVDSTEVDAFTPDHERLLTIAAAQAASAIENARLFAAERQRAEELKRAYENLQEADRLKSQFVQDVSHDLRTPLQFIKGYVDLLLDGAMGPLTEMQRKGIEVIAQNTDRLIKWVKNITTLYVLQEKGALLSSRSKLDLRQLLIGAATAAEAAANKAGIEIRYDLPAGEMWIMGDADRLTQVFDNILNNAIKFSPEGGTITVGAREADGHWLAMIRDTGVGIPADQLDKIFQRFYRVSGPTAKRSGGTGLGLAIAKEIVEMHGGKIWAESTLGQGSTFFVKLPQQGSENV